MSLQKAIDYILIFLMGNGTGTVHQYAPRLYRLRGTFQDGQLQCRQLPDKLRRLAPAGIRLASKHPKA